MIGKTFGVLPMQAIRSMIEQGQIFSHTDISSDQIQPASLDLRVANQAHRIRASFLTGKDLKVSERIDSFCMHSMDLTDGAVLEKGCVYLVELQEQLDLPENIHAAANAKSSTGRLDLLTRLITDHSREFDRIEGGYSGPLYAEICPRSFSVLVRKGSRLNQIRFRIGQPKLSDEAIYKLHQQDDIISASPIIVHEGLGFSVDLDRPDNLAGYRAKRHAGIIDMDAIGQYPIDDFWERVTTTDRQLVLDPESFYVLVSKEHVAIPPQYAAEMMPYIAMIGEFRVHYAGFFDPGFGWASANIPAKSQAVLEVRCHEAPFALQDGQQVGRLCFEAMTEPPTRPYGSTGSGSNYQGQSLKLSKHFCHA